MSGALLPNALAFGRVLRGLGLDAGPDRMIDLFRALDHVPIGSRRDFHDAARALLVRNRDEIPRFDQAFEAFWRKPSEGSTALDLRAMGEKRRFRRPAFEPEAPVGSLPEEGGGDLPEAPPRLRLTRTWSAAEVLRHKDFGELTAEELAEVRRAIAHLDFTLAPRRVRRLKPGDGRLVDLRRTLRRGLSRGGEILEWSRRERREKPRRIVVLADISGSMERYTRMLLLFLHALARGYAGDLEAFLFGTRLTRVTRELSAGNADDALAKVSLAVPDWSGGTRIGETLKEFNFRWGRRVLGRGAVVLVVSDGWDRGDPDLLVREMARLQASAHRVIWLNPLLGAADYAPLARGIREALPYVDDFLPVHDLASLERLARLLASVPAARALRRQRRLPGAA